MLIDYWRFACANPRFLGFGFFLAFLSSAGQTYFIGVFGTGIQSEFGLDAGEWGRIYMIGTLASAIVINWSGALIDRFDLRYFTAFVLLGLSAACLVMASTTSAFMLIFSIFMLRQFGQGLSSHAGITTMARYHDADRGKAIALAAIGFAVGEASLPLLGTYLSQVWGWRDTFRLVAGAILVSIPLALWLLKDHGKRHATHVANLDNQSNDVAEESDYSRRQVLSEVRFYFMLPAMIAPALIGTALFFFPAEIARAKGWSDFWITGNYWLYSIVAVAITIFSGVLIDRFSARQILPLFLIPMALALVMLTLSDHKFLVWPYMMLLGMTTGMYFTGFSALWAELYGARNLGAIKSMTNAIMVFASALGPALVGSMLEWQFSFAQICWLLILMCVVATAMLVYALRLPVSTDQITDF